MTRRQHDLVKACWTHRAVHGAWPNGRALSRRLGIGFVTGHQLLHSAVQAGLVTMEGHRIVDVRPLPGWRVWRFGGTLCLESPVPCP